MKNKSKVLKYIAKKQLYPSNPKIILNRMIGVIKDEDNIFPD